MSKKYFCSLTKIWEEYFPRKIELKRLEIKTPREFGNRIVDEIFGSVREMLEEAFKINRI